MNNHFEEFFLLVEEVKKNLEKKDLLNDEMEELRSNAKNFYSSVIAKYQEEEKQINHRIEQAKKENEDNKVEIVELTRQQLKADTIGVKFNESERLDKLKTEVSTYQLKVEAMERLKEDVFISKSDQVKLKEYRTKGHNIQNCIRSITEKIQSLLADLRGDCILNCLASMEYIPGSSGFMDEEFDILQSMRKEEIKE